MRRLSAAAPFESGVAARTALGDIMRTVEDELSGIPENPNAAIAQTDGRMYPPDDRFEVETHCAKVRLFKQLRHRTFIGQAGAIQIVRSDGTIEIDLAGSDGTTIADLLLETKHELN
jgi:hypothetical protein